MLSGNGRYEQSRSLDGTTGKPDVAAEAGTAWTRENCDSPLQHCRYLMLAVPSRSSCEGLNMQVCGRHSCIFSSGKLKRARRGMRTWARRRQV